MRKYLLSCLIACFTLTACADHASSLAVLDTGPEAPINDPDTNSFQPGTDEGSDDAGSSNGEVSLPGDSNSGGSNSAQEGGSGNAQEGGSGGSTEAGVANPPAGQGGGGGQPVPEPGTLLLVGTGLASAALLRRRRKPVATEA